VTEVVDYFNQNKRPDVLLLGVELVCPADGDQADSGEFTHLPILPFAPMMAHRPWHANKSPH